MKTSTVSSWSIPVSLLLIAGLSSTACARFSAHHSPHGESGYAHAHSGAHDGDYDAGTSRHDGHHSGMPMQHGKSHQNMHSSGRGHHHSKGHDDRGYRSMHPGAHRGALAFIDHILKFQEGMSLTDDQVKQLRTLKTHYKKTRITMKADIKLANVDLHELMQDKQASLTDIETQLNALHALKAKLHLESIKAQRQAMAVLTEEQQARMDTIHKRIKSHGGPMTPQGGSPMHRKYNKHGQE